MAVRIQVTQYYIQLFASATDPEFIKLIDNVRGIEKYKTKDTYRCSLRLLPEVLELLRGITSADQIPVDNSIHQLYVDECNRRRYTKSLKELGPDMSSEWLWQHQCLGIELAQINKRYNFFYDTRTGKTLMMLRIMYDRLKSGQAKRCLVICPSSIVKAWLGDAATHFPELKLTAVYGDAANRQKAMNTPAHIVVWATEHVANNIATLKQVHFDCCVFDESSKLKNHRTEIAKAARELSLTIPSWYNLSATPAPNGKHEYYTQMMCLDPYVFSSARTRFVDKYFDNKSRNVNYEKLFIKPSMEDEFMRIVEDYSIYVDQSAMPTAGKKWQVVPFNLNSESIKAYNTMCTEMYADVGGVTILADMAAAMRAKLNQLTSGFIMDTGAIKENANNRKLHLSQDAVEVYTTGDNSRIDCLKNLLDNLGGQKVVIWANYTAEFRMLEELLGDRARYVRGGTSIEEKEQWIYTEFKKGPLQYLVCHPLSVGMGINLTEAHVAIYYSMNDSWEAFKQSSERIYGHINVQPHVCEYYILQAVDTVNELIYANVTNKRDASTGFLEHLKARALE